MPLHVHLHNTSRTFVEILIIVLQSSGLEEDAYTRLCRQYQIHTRLDVMRHVYIKLKLSQNVTNNDFNFVYGKHLSDAISCSSAERHKGMRINLSDSFR